MTPEQITEKLTERFPDFAEKCVVDKGHAVVEIPARELLNFMKTMKDDAEFRFDMMMDLTAVDWPERKPRFDLVYHLYSVEHNHRLRIRVPVADGESAPSLADLWPIADAEEREVWDMYGIKFSGHPNLKRLLLYEEFKGHPLRKDYPYDKRQPLVDETWPVRDRQIQLDEAKELHRP